jgi:hypothetical protein
MQNIIYLFTISWRSLDFSCNRYGNDIFCVSTTSIVGTEPRVCYRNLVNCSRALVKIALVKMCRAHHILEEDVSESKSDRCLRTKRTHCLQNDTSVGCFLIFFISFCRIHLPNARQALSLIFLIYIFLTLELLYPRVVLAKYYAIELWVYA